MRRVTSRAVGLALAAVLIAGCGDDDDGGSGGGSTSSAPATTEATSTDAQEAVPAVVKVSIGDNFYKPEKVTIARGQSVSWRNTGGVAHTVTSDDKSTVKFDSGTLEPNSAYALKPTKPGEISYFCTIHGTVQSGTITVTR